jgi:hypothetical protein
LWCRYGPLRDLAFCCRGRRRGRRRDELPEDSAHRPERLAVATAAWAHPGRCLPEVTEAEGPDGERSRRPDAEQPRECSPAWREDAARHAGRRFVMRRGNRHLLWVNSSTRNWWARRIKLLICYETAWFELRIIARNPRFVVHCVRAALSLQRCGVHVHTCIYSIIIFAIRIG